MNAKGTFIAEWFLFYFTCADNITYGLMFLFATKGHYTMFKVKSIFINYLTVTVTK